MNKSKQKLELTEIDKDMRPKLEPRILLDDSSKSYQAKPWKYLLIPHDVVGYSSTITSLASRFSS